MKFRLLFSSVVAALGAASASAQSPNTLQVKIPCAFTVSENVLPAGEYLIGRVSPGSNLLLIRSEETGRTVLFAGSTVERSSAPARSSLVFGRDRGDYFLQDIWWAGYSAGVQLPVVKTITELASAAGPRAPEVVVIRRR